MHHQVDDGCVIIELWGAVPSLCPPFFGLSQVQVGVVAVVAVFDFDVQEIAIIDLAPKTPNIVYIDDSYLRSAIEFSHEEVQNEDSVHHLLPDVLERISLFLSTVLEELNVAVEYFNYAGEILQKIDYLLILGDSA